MKKRNKGFTLVELLLGLAITAVILTVGVQFLRVSMQEFRVVSKEYAVQNGVRTSMNNISNVVKESTAIFAVGQDKFDPKNPLGTMKPEWNYIGIREVEVKDEDGNPIKDEHGNVIIENRLVNYVWVWKNKDMDDGFHKEVEIDPGDWNIKDVRDGKVNYHIGFYRDDEDKPIKPTDVDALIKNEKTVKVYLKGQVEDTSFVLNNNIIAQNVNQLIDARPKTHREYPVTALAYRTEPLKDAPVNAAVVFVVDISGSMERNMKGQIESNVDKRRFTIMQQRAKEFVTELEKSGKVDLYFVPFETNLYGRIRMHHAGTNTFYIEQEYFKYHKLLSGTDLIAANTVNWDARSKAIAAYDMMKELYENRNWNDAKTETEAKNLLDRATVIATDPIMKRHVTNQTEVRQKAELVHELYLRCIQLMKQPYALNQARGQASLAHKYIDQALIPHGGTNLGAGIREAYRILQKSDKRLKYMVVLSDGGPEHYDYLSQRHDYIRYIKKTPFVPPAAPGASVGDFVPTPLTPEQIEERRKAWDKQFSYKKRPGGVLTFVGEGNGNVKLARWETPAGTPPESGNLMLESSSPGLTQEDRQVLIKVGDGQGDYIDTRYEEVAEGTGDFRKWEGNSSPWASVDVRVSRTINKPAAPVPGQPLDVEVLPMERFHWPAVAKLYVQRVMSNAYGMNVKNLDGTYFIKRTFLIGFADDGDDPNSFKTYMKKDLIDYSQAGGGTEITEYKDASSSVSLAEVFKEVTKSVQEDMWYFDGP